MYSDFDYLMSPLEIEDELKKYFNLNKVNLVLDIGACDGLDSIKYARLFPNSEVYSFEPLIHNLELVKKNLNTFNIKNVIPIPLALSDSKGKAIFYVSSGRPNDVEGTEDLDFGNKSSSLCSLIKQ